MNRPIYFDNLLEEDWEIIRKGLADYSIQYNQPPFVVEPAAFVCRDGERLVGGLSGWSARGGFDIGAFWVSPDMRRQGIGSELVRAAEEIARSRGCLSIFVWTMNYQAPNFYAKHGFEKVVERPADNNGTVSVGFMKILSK
ncbi:MAG: GNAT family N-acetyltransferase [Bdellovibrionales bacterium]|jgi:ribosomal protein S18 acetylase RimI-like enzyme